MSNNKSIVPGRLTFRPVPLENGQCKGDHLHFKGVAREVYKYLKMLGANHGGFVFPSVENITEHTIKNWRKKTQYSERQVKRILKMFRKFGVLGERTTRTIEGRTYEGWQFVEHVFWAQPQGHICEFKHWLEYEDSFQPESFQQFKQQNVTPDVTELVTANVT